MTLRQKILAAALVGVPLLTIVLYLISGRELFTKNNRIVGVTLTDELFGGSEVVQQSVRGPIFGLYIGLDLVMVTVLLSLAIGIIWWLVHRRRNLRKQPI